MACIPHHHAHMFAVRSMVVCMHAQADEMLADAKKKYESGDRMTALRVYEDVLKTVSRAGQLGS